MLAATLESTDRPRKDAAQLDVNPNYLGVNEGEDKRTTELVRRGLRPARDTAARKFALLTSRVTRKVASSGGVMPWWRLRQALGGHCPSDRIEDAVDALLGAGVVVELWADRGDCGEVYSHYIAQPGLRSIVPGVIVEVRGRADLIDAEFSDIV